MTKPLRTRLRLVNEALNLLAPGAPFVQFTYAVVSPIPRRLTGVRARSLRADLAQCAAGARLGLSPRLSVLTSIAKSTFVMPRRLCRASTS